MNKLLLSKPMMSDKLREQLRIVGIDTSDEELQTNAALLSATIMQKALQGDTDAIKTAFEMAGMSVTARDQAERQKLRLEDRKLKIIERGGAVGAEIPAIRIEPAAQTSTTESEV